MERLAVEDGKKWVSWATLEVLGSITAAATGDFGGYLEARRVIDKHKQGRSRR